MVERKGVVYVPLPTFSDAELDAFLKRPLLGRLGTLQRSGYPHVVPVWFLYEEGRFLMTLGRESIKAQNVMRDPRIALTIDDPEPPYRAVMTEGVAEVDESVGTDLAFQKRVSRHYLGEDGSNYYMASPITTIPRIRVILRPSKIITWDMSK